MRFQLAVAASLACLLSSPLAMAQTATDMTEFSATCLGADDFLLGQPEGVDPAPIMTPLCACLSATFGPMPEKDVAMLTTDLRGEGTDEAHAAHGAYEELAGKAREGVTACLADPEVAAAMQAAMPEAQADPAPEPAPQ